MIAEVQGFEQFELSPWDMLLFAGYFAALCVIGYLAGRKKKDHSDDYFLAGRSLPWYVVGCSFIASNISAEHFIGMIGAAVMFGVCVAIFEWGNVLTFSILIWFFIPFLLTSRVFTTPEFLERRFNSFLRQCFAAVTVITNVIAFLAAVLYGGGVALEKLFGWDIWVAIVVVAVAAGIWAIYGGLKSVAWMDVLTVIIMIGGGLLVTLFGLAALSEDGRSIVDGFQVMLERNREHAGVPAEIVARNANEITRTDEYNRLSIIQPSTHTLVPWPGLIFMVFTISLWYNVINQFMIQRVLGAKDMYHARMGIVLAGYMKIILPIIVVLPGLILFALHPEIMTVEWDEVATQADKGYVHLLQTLIPVGLRGLFLAALFGAIQSTVQAVLNATSTVFTVDVYHRLLYPQATQQHLVRVGRISAFCFLILAVVLARLIAMLDAGLFQYIQTLYAFFAPPFGAIFLLGILFRRINAAGATAAIIGGFAFAGATKLYVHLVPDHPYWIDPFLMQATFTWIFCVIVCIAVSLLTAPPRAEQVTDNLTINWRRLNIFAEMGSHWYSHVVFWWGLFVVLVVGLILLFSGIWF